MVEIRRVIAEQYINAGTAQYCERVSYTILRLTDGDLKAIGEGNDIPIALPQLPSDIDPPELLLRYWRRTGGFFETSEEVPIDPVWVKNTSVPLGMLLSLTNVEDILREQGEIIDYVFEIVGRGSVSLSQLQKQGSLQVEERRDAEYYTVTISHRIRHENQDVPIRDYAHKVGNLETDILGGLDVLTGAGSAQCIVEIDSIGRPFRTEDIPVIVADGLQRSDLGVASRVPNYIREVYPASMGHPLDVVVTIPHLLANTPYSIRATYRNPANELYFRTENTSLNELALNINRKVLTYGIPIRPIDETYQRVLMQLLLYRQGCLNIRAYITNDVVQRGEIRGFHRHIHDKLHHFLTFGTPIFHEVELGNSRADLLIGGYPTELKLNTQVRATTLEIVGRSQAQAADYVARTGADLGFLVILDTVPNRPVPTPLAHQDVHVVQVKNASGQSTVVIAILVRVPPSPSSHTAST